MEAYRSSIFFTQIQQEMEKSKNEEDSIEEDDSILLAEYNTVR